MPEVDVFHRICTHAASGPLDSAGLRTLTLGKRNEERDASRLLPPDLMAELDDLLRKTTPAGNTTGYVVRRYVSGGDAFTCVAATYPDLVNDAHGRRGLLTHARVVRIDPAESWLDVPALIEAVESFPIAEVCAASAEARVAAYLDCVVNEATLFLRPVVVSELQEVSPAFLSDALVAFLAGIGQRRGTRFAVAPPDSLVEGLAMAWCALPTRLQRTSSWGVEVAEGCPVDAVFSKTSGARPAGVGAESLVDFVGRYVALFSEAPQDVHAILRNPELTTVVTLSQAIDRATVAAPLSKVSGKGAMKKEKKGREEMDALDPEVIAEINRQVRAMESVLRAYVDQRLANLESRQLLAPRQERRSFWRDPRVIAPLLVPLLTVIALALFAWRWSLRPANDRRERPAVTRSSESPQIDPLPEAVPTETVSPEQAALSRLLAKASASRLWAESFRALLDTEPVNTTRFIVNVANDPEVDTPATIKELTALADKVARKQDLKSEGRDRLRALLVDFIARRVASDDGIGSDVNVDGDLRDAKTVLDRVRSRVGAKSPAVDINDRDLQSEIILRWMESRGQ